MTELEWKPTHKMRMPRALGWFPVMYVGLHEGTHLYRDRGGTILGDDQGKEVAPLARNISPTHWMWNPLTNKWFLVERAHPDLGENEYTDGTSLYCASSSWRIRPIHSDNLSAITDKVRDQTTGMLNSLYAQEMARRGAEAEEGGSVASEEDDLQVIARMLRKHWTNEYKSEGVNQYAAWRSTAREVQNLVETERSKLASELLAVYRCVRRMGKNLGCSQGVEESDLGYAERIACVEVPAVGAVDDNSPVDGASHHDRYIGEQYAAALKAAGYDLEKLQSGTAPDDLQQRVIDLGARLGLPPNCGETGLQHAMRIISYCEVSTSPI